eukprot:TRINITY_DN2331_c1_g1_i1.p1 TRINITY_DN2331_c1_g1~~TRINITY_DN2331_c1_g1_i1.p1  ORF type:complete len:114 (+),score=30.88 TRINITY_DN2331_c1_g1_i1:58-399(+)
MMMRRFATGVVSKPLRMALRTNMHQEQQKGEDDTNWAESDAHRTPEERYAYAKQQEILKAHAERINAQHEAEHKKTRDHLEDHQNKNAASIARLEARIAELTSMIQQMQAENK